jgi:hypothetical protein
LLCKLACTSAVALLLGAKTGAFNHSATLPDITFSGFLPVLVPAAASRLNLLCKLACTSAVALLLGAKTGALVPAASRNPRFARVSLHCCADFAGWSTTLSGFQEILSGHEPLTGAGMSRRVSCGEPGRGRKPHSRVSRRGRRLNVNSSSTSLAVGKLTPAKERLLAGGA